MDDFIRNHAKLKGNKQLTLTFDIKNSEKEFQTRDENNLGLVLSRLDGLDSMNKILNGKMSKALYTVDQIVEDQAINTGYLDAKIRRLNCDLIYLKFILREIILKNKYENVIPEHRHEKRLEYLDLMIPRKKPSP